MAAASKKPSFGHINRALCSDAHPSAYAGTPATEELSALAACNVVTTEAKLVTPCMEYNEALAVRPDGYGISLATSWDGS